MQRLGHAVGKKWAFLSFQELSSASKLLCGEGPRLIPWALPAFIATSLPTRKCAFRSASATSTIRQTEDFHALREDDACEALYFSGTPPATDILGPISVRDIPGKGRGLVAQREMRPGDLVMTVQPIVVLHGQQDSMPSPDSLVEHLKKSWPGLPARHRSAIRQMFVGPTHTPARTTSNYQPTTDGESPTASEARAAAGATSTGACGNDHGVGGVDFRAIVSYNAYGDEYEDLPAADLRGGAPPQSHVGLWPYFSQLNHACAPNCVHYVVGSTMVVRAVQVIPEGCELLISYLGRDDLAPRRVRQAALKTRYGFTCNCARCQTESELPEELQALLQQLYDRARHELVPRFERLAAAASAAAAGEGLDGVAGPYGDIDDDDNDADGVEAPFGSSSGGGVAAPAGGSEAVGGAIRLSPGSWLTGAEVAKRALRKWARQSSGTQHQLVSLESRLEDCARQLHLAIQELQEDDEALKDAAAGRATTAMAASAAAVAAPPAAASPPGSGRYLTRVQTAQTAAYQLLELLHLHAELTAAAAAGGGGVSGRGGHTRAAATGALQACWHVLDAISRGSELQVFQACKMLNDALQASRYHHGKAGADRMASTSEMAKSSPSPPGGPSQSPPRPLSAPAPHSDVVREVAALLGLSLLARYGKLRGQRLTQMTQAAIRASRGFF